jgi:hypothetical protein
MLRVKVLCLVLTLLFCASKMVDAQSESPLAIRIEQTIRRKEPGWKVSRGIQSGRVPIVPSERTLVATSWERKLKSGGRESVSLNVYEVESSTEAARWLRPIGEGKVASGWRVEKVGIAEEAYLSTFRGGRGHTLHFRRGNTVVEVSGGALNVVKKFAQYVVAEIDAS